MKKKVLYAPPYFAITLVKGFGASIYGGKNGAK